MNIGFDPKCLELAEYFLPDSPKARQCRLAQVIQDTIEAFDFVAECTREKEHAGPCNGTPRETCRIGVKHG